MIYASRFGKIDAVRELIKNNADVNIYADDGTTPILAACIDGHSDVVKELIKANADINRADNVGYNPLI